MSTQTYIRIDVDVLPLAHEAAPGAVYFGRVESVEAQYDDDSGYYMNTSVHFENLYDARKTQLAIADPAAYQAFFEQVSEAYDEDSGDGPSEHVSAYEMMVEVGYVDEFALEIAYSVGDLPGLVHDLPDQASAILRFARRVGDQRTVNEVVQGFCQVKLLR